MIPCLFVADLHGSAHRARALLAAVLRERPRAVFLGGDLLAHGKGAGYLQDLLIPGLTDARRALGEAPPEVFVILGNDDPRVHEPVLASAAAHGVWHYLHGASADLDGFTILGYNCVPPTPFRLKDWERYDVSRFVDPGCVSPEEGALSVPEPPSTRRLGTIAADLERLAGGRDLTRAVCLFHCPPYRTALDRAALDNRQVDHAPADVHVGSIAIRRFMESRAPWLGLHGHVHESPRLTGSWRDRVGRTLVLSGAHDGPELALVRFDLERPEGATRVLV